MAIKDLAPRLRHRIDIQEMSIDESATNGAIVETWATIFSSDEPDLIPAEIVPLSGREFISAASVQAGVNTRITIRRRDDVTATMRVVHGGDYYNIKAVLPDPSLRHHLTLMCESGVNEG
jgi:SPP1 family predicted phage head-tail adaptor